VNKLFVAPDFSQYNYYCYLLVFKAFNMIDYNILLNKFVISSLQ